MHNLGFKTVRGRGFRGGKQKLHVKDLMKQHPMLFCTLLYLLETEFSSVDKAWLVKRKGQPLHWILNKLLTNKHLSIT